MKPSQLPMNIVFCVNRLGLIGLGATLTSLIRNCSDSRKLKLWFFGSELISADTTNIKYLLTDELFAGETEFIDINIKSRFGHLTSLHHDWTAYGRLLIPEIITAEYALYLDADLIIGLDILQLSSINSYQILSAVHEGPVRLALDNYLFINKLNWNPVTPYFNSGVLLFNIKQWVKYGADATSKEVAKVYSEHLISHDQTILNAVCAGDFNHLPKEFNVSWPPNEKRLALSTKCITHFIGAPKPWDLWGKSIHNGYALWAEYNTDFWNKKYGKLNTQKLARTWHIRKSIAKNIGLKLFAK
jgi:lipopolysaccharide biosynthesis glycosyltransferase